MSLEAFDEIHSLLLPGRDVVEEFLVVGLLVAEAVEGLELEVLLGQLLLDIAGDLGAGIRGRGRGGVVGVGLDGVQLGGSQEELLRTAVQAVVVVVVAAAIVAALVGGVVDVTGG